MTAAGLLDLLDHVKRRNNLLVALGLACLFAWWIKGATPDSEGPFGTLRHQQADWNASADLIALQVVKINEWASTHAPDRIWRARSQVNDVGMSLGSHGWRARWFVLSNEFGSFESAWQQVHAHPLALRQDTWTASSFKAFASLTLGYKMQPSEVRDMLAVRAEFSAAAGRPEEAALARTGLSALDQLTATFAELAWTMNPALAGAVSDAGQIAASMEKSGFQAYAPFARMVQAEQIRKELATTAGACRTARLPMAFHAVRVRRAWQFEKTASDASVGRHPRSHCCSLPSCVARSGERLHACRNHCIDWRGGCLATQRRCLGGSPGESSVGADCARIPFR